MNAVATRSGIDLTVVENSSADDHGWSRSARQANFELVTLSDTNRHRADQRRCARELEFILNRVRPDVIVSCGYSERHSWMAARRHRRRQPGSVWVAWSESSRRDHRRWPPVELAKRFLLAGTDGGLVAGGPQAEYLRSLGMPEARICQVGGCVDNAYFRKQSAQQTRAADGSNYFLYVGRLVAVKNLPFLLSAYARYRAEIVRRGLIPWNLLLVGGGGEENRLRRLVSDERIEGVEFTGPSQIDQVARYYAGARALVLPSYSEPWGLVVNEAMASGLPTLVSAACGCAEDLVAPGVTGYLFHPRRIDTCVDALVRMSLAPLEAEECKAEIFRRVEAFSPEEFARKAAGHFERLLGDMAEGRLKCESST
jgi:glycosyltransferase involved in cell wall biosynthesis